MRGKDEQQLDVFLDVNPEQRVPQEYPLRSLRAMTEEALQQLEPRFNNLCAKICQCDRDKFNGTIQELTALWTPARQD